MKIKICTKCGKDKELSEFYFRKDSGKYRNECKKCLNDKNSQWYKKVKNNIEFKQKRKIYHKKYQQENPNKIKKDHELFYKNNPDYNKEYYKNNKAKWPKKDPIKNSEQCRKYRKNNKEKTNKRSVNKYKNDINYRILHNLRTRINLALNGNPKFSTTKKLIGCSIKHLKQHLESQFTDGMNWKNHAVQGWHIDHILPCASFDLSKPSEQEKCFHFSNLQPLWAVDNLKKGSKIIKFFEGEVQ